MIPRLSGGRLLRGPNVHHHTTVYVVHLEPGVLADTRPADAGAEFGAGFLAKFAGVSCPPNATILDCLLEAVLAVERVAAVEMGRPVGARFGRLVRTATSVDLVWEARSAWISRAASRVALAGLLELLPGHLDGVSAEAAKFDDEMAKLVRRARRRQWTPAAAAIARAATARRVPYELLAGSYVRLGEGVRQQVVSASAAGDDGPEQLLDSLIPFDTDATIPVTLIVGERGTGFVARALDRWLRATHAGVGLALKDRITVQGSPIDPSAVGRRRGVSVLLGDPRVDVAIGALSPGSILSRGLGVERADVVVLPDLGPAGDRRAYEGALRVVFAARPRIVVLSASNPWTEWITRVVRSPEQVVIVCPGQSPLSLAHAAAGGLVVQTVGRSHAVAELRRRTEAIGTMPIVWPGSEARPHPTDKELGRALLAAGAAFAVDRTTASPTNLPDFHFAPYSRMTPAAVRSA
jgi:hypothetical protein